MEKCPKLQKILEKDYSYNDVTIILILDNNELYIDKKYYHPGISLPLYQKIHVQKNFEIRNMRDSLFGNPKRPKP